MPNSLDANETFGFQLCTERQGTHQNSNWRYTSCTGVPESYQLGYEGVIDVCMEV
jgi:hypothetical protein